MRDLNQILDGTVEDVAGVVGTLTREELAQLHALEEMGKNRRGVMSAISAALAAQTGAADIQPATAIAPSGAPVQTLPDLDLTHPAVDDNPRANTSVDQNRIDFNDPSLDGREVVEAALAQQVEG